MKKILLFALSLNLLLSVYSFADNTILNSLVEKSITLNEENKPDSSIFFSTQALQIATINKDLKKKAMAEYQLAKSFLLKSDFTNAMQYILSSDSIYESLNDSSGIAQCNLQMGLIEYTQRNYIDALPYFNTSIKMAGDENAKLVNTCNYLKGLAYLELERFDKADSLLNMALMAKKESGNENGYYECLYGLAELNYKRQKFGIATNLYTECLNYFLEKKNPAGTAISHIGLANIFNAANQKDSALKHYLISYHLSRDNDYQDGKLKSTKMLSDLYREKKIFEKAFNFLKEYHEQYDSIYNIDNARKLAKLRYQLSLANNQIEIEQLNKKAELNKLLLILMISVTLLFIGITISVYRSYRFKKRANLILEKAFSDLKNAQQQLIRHEKLAALGHLTAGVAHELKNPLNFIINFSADSQELLSEIPPSTDDDTLKNLKINLEKIEFHGNRANSIVSNMMMHSRHLPELKAPTDLVKLLHETIDLAYQGMKATYPSFYCKLNIDIEKDNISANVLQQEIARVFLNILNNAFYATMKRIEKESSYVPEIKVKLRKIDNEAKIVLEDNGIGMDENVRVRIFEPFFTTKPTGEGTGLGLSMSYEMIESNGGTITVESELMAFTRFNITLLL